MSISILEVAVRAFFVLLLTSAIFGAALPTDARAQSAVSPAAPMLAARLVDLTLPIDAIQSGARDSFASNFRASFLRDPRAQAAVQRTPALLDTVVRGGTSKLDEVLAALWPEVKARLSASYLANMTPEELESAVAFYSGPVGKKLVEATPVIATGGDIAQILDTTELANFAAFVQSPAGQKIEALKSQQTRDIGEAVNRAFVKSQREIDEAAMLAGRAYLAANPE